MIITWQNLVTKKIILHSTSDDYYLTWAKKYKKDTIMKELRKTIIRQSINDDYYLAWAVQ